MASVPEEGRPILQRVFGRIRAHWFPEPASEPLINQRAVAGPVPWVIAIMTALTVIAAAGGLALGGVARTAQSELAGGVTVQIAGPGEAEAAKQAKAAVAAISSLDGVAKVRRLAPAERAELLRPWLGTDAVDDSASPGQEDLLVMPELIEVQLAGRADRAALDRLATAIEPGAPDASVNADMEWLAPLAGAIDALQWLALALVGLLATATAAAVLLASRSALAANRDTIEIMHLLGAHDIQVAKMFQKAAVLSAAAGGAAGFAVAEAAIFVLSGRFAALGPGNTAAGLRWHDWIALVLIPLAAVLLAGLTARLTVLATLRRLP